MNNIARGLDFLHARQLPHGEFQTFAAPTPGMRTCEFYGSPFVTAFVLYALRTLEHSNLSTLREHALDFLIHEQEPEGYWRNHTRDNPKHAHQKLPPDLDDIAVISHILAWYYVPFVDTRALILSNITGDGVFATWIEPPFANEVDAVVNANVVLYLQDDRPPVCAYLNTIISRKLPFSQWYPDRLSLYYVVSRALANGVTGLAESRQGAIDDILSRQQSDGSWGNALRSALALNALLNYGANNAALVRGIGALRRMQTADGSWPRHAWFRGFANYYGSEELTTALAIEALTKI